jgi:isopenicillin N synthase-like dioxygenase
LFCDADISPLLAKSDDPKMVDDPAVLDVVKQLDKACTEAGFFYVVIIPSIILIVNESGFELI